MEHDSQDSDVFDVAIIGAGPVGSTLANYLGHFGLRTAILDREGAAYHLPRAVVFDDEAMRIFQNLGLEDDMLAITQNGLDAVFVDAAGRELVRWNRPLEKTENGWYVNYRFHQPELEDVLRRGMGRFAQVFSLWNWEVEALEELDDHVCLTGHHDGQPARLKARYVVGCDGARSFTRHAIGGGLEDLGFHEDWLILDFILPEAEPDPDRNTYHYCGTSRMGSKVFVGDRRKRWELRLNDDDDRARLNSPEAAWEMVRQWITPDEATLERIALYTFHSAIARQWRKGRVLIAGDAAHQTPPFMGQGMVAGLRDVANLGWKLAFVVAGHAPEGLLESYQSERHTHVRVYIDQTIELGRLINRTRARISGETVRDAGDGHQTMSKLRPALGPGMSAGSGELRGRMFPQFPFGSGARLDDVIGLGMAVIVAPDLPVAPALAEAFAAAGVVLVRAEQDDLAGWLEDAGASAVLVRPDRYVAGHVRKPEDLGDLLPECWVWDVS